jgi:aspartyl-tRNA(Asn)/glutamyl-tRNA(Gln) amidotransferase subunit B
VGEWEEPNVAVCPICLAHPGSLPVPNRIAVIFAVSLGLALKGEISRVSHFYRKNYFYPDLPKGYQITQYSVPIVRNAWILGKRIERLNLEECCYRAYRLGKKEAGEFLKGYYRYFLE